MVSGVVAREVKVSEACVCFEEFPDFPAFIRVDEFHRQADGVAVFHGNADKPFVFGYCRDLINPEMFFKEFGIPADCKDALVGCESVYEGAEDKGE